MASSAAPTLSAPNLLASLPPRPPTPPREARPTNHHDVDTPALPRPIALNRSQAVDRHRSLQTPPKGLSPVSSSAASNSSSNRVHKKVEWSNHTQYKDPPQYHNGSRLAPRSPVSAPPSASSKPVKGILKPSPSPFLVSSCQNSSLQGPCNKANLGEMLESTIKQLAGSDRDSRLDAYMMLSRALKASDNLPDRVALQDKMSLLVQFIQRDVVAKKEDGSLDGSLANHALVLTVTLFHFQAIASTLTFDFGVFMMDHAIRCFQDPCTPKDVVGHVMQVVAFQNFPAKVITADRVGRLVAALHDIERQVQGKSIVCGRLLIYKKLVQQARRSMLTHSDWLKDMFNDLLSNIKEVRAKALSLGTEAGFALRSDKLLFRKVAEILQETKGDKDQGESYIEFYIKRLQGMLEKKQSCYAVPQIWSVVILFMRCPLEKWQFYSDWLSLVGAAFNKADLQTKQEANFAWNRYAYLSMTDSKSSAKTLTTLRMPLLTQLKRKGKQSEAALKLRGVVVGGLCNFYSHLLAEVDRKYNVDTVWDVAMQPVMVQLIDVQTCPDIAKGCMDIACRILTSLLDTRTPRLPPKLDSVVVHSTLLTPEELMPIDSKWVRRHCDKVFQVAGRIVEGNLMDLALEQSQTSRLWQAFVGAIATASAKDIKVSDETASFVALGLGMLSKIWAQGVGPSGLGCNNEGVGVEKDNINKDHVKDSAKDSATVSATDSATDSSCTQTRFLASIGRFVDTMTQSLGLLPFTEKKLCASGPNAFQIIATPSRRADKSHKGAAASRTPLHHLFLILSSAPCRVANDEALARMLVSRLQPFFHSRSATGRRELARELVHLLPRNALSPWGPWLLAAENMRPSLDQALPDDGSAPPSSDSLLGPVFREVVALLERGIRCHPNLPVSHWASLFDLVSNKLARGYGDAGRTLVLVEPLAKALLENGPSSSLSLAAMTKLFSVAKLARDGQALDAARQRLWGAPPVKASHSALDALCSLYKLGSQGLHTVYHGSANADPSHADSVHADSVLADSVHADSVHVNTGPVLEAVATFLTKCLPEAEATMVVLSEMQHGICPWVQDEANKLPQNDSHAVTQAMYRLWHQICTNITACRPFHRKNVDKIEPLLTAAFKSKHVYVVSKATQVWNVLSDSNEDVHCSDSLKSIVSSLHTRLESNDADFGAQTPLFVGASYDQALRTPSSKAPTNGALQAMDATNQTPQPSTLTKRRLDAPLGSDQTSCKKRTVARPRHQDSQLSFVAITDDALPTDESQHLTENQKAVRQRQREEAFLYSDLRTSSPDASPHGSHGGKEDTTNMCKLVQVEDSDSGDLETTSRQEALFEDLVVSTPTPRQGQTLPMLDMNDPPSSPPVPRPHPLLAEIESRSRASADMNSWEYSSPTTSPTAMNRRALEERTSNQDDQSVKGSKRQKSHVQEVPIAEAELSGNDDDRIDESASLEVCDELPNTSDFTLSSFLVSQSYATDKGGAKDETTSAPSFEMSETDEDQMEHLLARVEQGCELKGASRADDEDHEYSSPVKAQIVVAIEGVPAGRRKRGHHTPSPENVSGRTRRQNWMSSAVPSTPAKTPDQDEGCGSKRKRKRGQARQTSVRSSKRRRSIASGSNEPSDGQASSPGPIVSPCARKALATSPPESLPKQRQQTTDTDTDRTDQEPEDGDTDEEVASQLTQESAAASVRSHSTQPDELEAATKAQPPAKATTTKDMTSKKTIGHEKGINETDIMTTLRGGLDQLRSAALGREAVYELEDVLMDIKRELYEAELRGRRTAGSLG